MCTLSFWGQFIQVNPALERLLVRSTLQIQDRGIFEIIDPEDHGKLRKELSRILLGEALVRFETRILTPEGKKALIAWSARADARTLEIAMIGRDLSEMNAIRNERDQLLRLLNEAGVVTFTDAIGRIKEVSSRFCELSGYPRDELIGADHRILNSGRHSKGFMRGIWETITRGDVWQGEIQNRKKDGSEFRVQTAIGPYGGSVDSPGGYIALRYDVTEIALKESEIQKRGRFLEAVLGHLPLMILVKSFKDQMRFSLINRFGENLIGLSSDGIVGKSIREMFPGELGESYHQKDLEIFREGKVIRTEREDIQTPLGIRHLRTFKIPTFDEAGNPDLLISISEDISHELQAKDALEKERIKSIQSSKMALLGELSAGVAHEINNPLTVISGTLELMPRWVDNPEKREQKVLTMQKSVLRIGKIVSGLRRFSRSSSLSTREDHSLNEIVLESLAMVEHKSSQHSVPVTFEAPRDLKIRCNEIEFEQIVINLVSNAIDAAKGLKERWVRVSAHSSDGEVVLRVRDSGPGIPADVVGRLFDPFFTTKPVGSGTGLGLSIVKGILDEHGASIQVDGEDPHTCFEVKIPCLDSSFGD